MEKINSILKEKTKCKIIEELMKKELSFSELLKMTKLRDHGQLNYHLKILGAYDLIKKDDKYSLTPLGIKMGVYVSQFQLKEIYPVSVVCPIVRNSEGKILLVKRAKAPYKGFWGFPGGKMRIGETIKEATKREVLEESGLRIKFNGVKGFVSAIVYRKKHLEFHANLIPVLAETKNDDVKLSDEHDDYLFVELKKAKKLKMIPANKEILGNLEKDFYFREVKIKDDIVF